MYRSVNLGLLLLLLSGATYARDYYDEHIVVVTPLQAEPLEFLEKRVYACTKETDSRKIIVDYPRGTPLPCRVNYDKSPKASQEVETIWQAINEEGFCEARADNLAARLKSTGWDCEKDSKRSDV